MSPSSIGRVIKALRIASALATMPIFAAADDLVVRHFGSAQGLPVSSATSAQIDVDGFLWFATHDGLARFDGRSFAVFDNVRFPDMGSNRILRLYAGKHMATYGLAAFGEWLQVGSRQIQPMLLDAQSPEAKVTFVTRAQPDTDENSSVNQLCLTVITGMYCESATPKGGFYQRRKFAEKLPVIAALPSGNDDWLVVPGQGIYYARANELTLLWASAALTVRNSLTLQAKVGRDGALVIDLANGVMKIFSDGRTQSIDPDPKNLIDAMRIELGPDNSVQISTSHEAYRIDSTGQRSQIHPKQELEAPLRSWPAPPPTIGQTATHSAIPGARWFSRGGTLYRNGVAVLQSRGVVQDVLFADSGVVWVSTHRDGVYALNPARVQAIADATLASSNVYGTSIAADGSVWVGSSGAGVFRIGVDDRVQRFNETHGLPGPHMSGIAVAPDQTVLGLALSGGLWQLRPGGSRFARSDLPPSLDRGSLTSMSFDAEGRFWLAGSAGAWCWEQPESGAKGWQKRWPTPDQTAWTTLNVKSVLHEDDGRTWYGTDQGLFWQQGAQSTQLQGLRGMPVRSVLRAHDGALWVATEGKGLQRFPAADLHGKTPQLIGRAQGMPSNSPHAIVQDQQQNLWINSNQGIFRLTPNEVEALRTGAVQALSPLTLGLADGLVELEGNGGVQPAAAVAKNGQIWFPTQRGIVRFHPARVGAARRPGRVIIEDVDAPGHALETYLTRAGLHALQLPPDVRALSIRYNAAELLAGQVRFRYRLLRTNGKLDVEKAWVDANSRNLASFDALAPGSYRFEVQAGSMDGVWRQESATLLFQVPAFFHETPAFRWSVATAMLLLIGFGVRWRLRTLSLRARQLERVVQNRTEELRGAKSKVEHTLAALANSHAALSESHLGIASRNQRLAEQTTRLEALDRFRSRLLADVSHELRSPLMLVHLPLQALSERSLPEQEKRLVAMASQQTGRLSHLVEQLVSLVQAEAQQIPLSLRRLDLQELVTRVVAGFEPVSLQTGVRFVVHSSTPEALPWVYLDAEHITTVLSNFLDNASKYAPAASEVRVGITFLPESDCLRVAVQDRGPGFAPELAAALFERFFRAEGPPRAGREGLGVGLALAQELIFLHGGRIGAINGQPDSHDLADAPEHATGACFWFELPLGCAHVALDDLALDVATQANVPPVLTLPASAAASASLLLVEDHPELAAYLAERLAEHCPVIVVADAEAAWMQLRQHNIAIVVTDVVLPGRSGIELCQSIKTNEAFAPMPVLLISAKAGKADRQSGLDAGAFDWLTKPFSLEALLSCVQRAWPTFGEPGAIHRPSQSAEVQPNKPRAQAVLTDDLAQDRLLALALAQLNQATFGVPEWSERAHLSERQLRRRVTELTGMAPVAWLREQRLLKVRELVTNASCRTLAEAGAMAGIDNAGYLYRLYRARFGTP